MCNYDPNLPDALRPTELTDFGDFFGTMRRVRQQVLLAVVLRAAPLIARLNALAIEAGSHAVSTRQREENS